MGPCKKSLPGYLRRLPGVLAIFVIAAASAGCAWTDSVSGDPAVARLAATSLRKFRDEAEFDAYRKRVHELGKKRNVPWPRDNPQGDVVGGLPTQNALESCVPTAYDCRKPAPDEAVVPPTRRSSVTSKMTKHREATINAGGIVKQYERFQIVLERDQLFSIDGAASPLGARLADRIDLSSLDPTDTRFDELLIGDNELIVTGYSDDAGVSQIVVVAINTAGELELNAIYFLESSSRYVRESDAIRLARDKLVIYTPVDISQDESLKIPRIRSWTVTEGLSPWVPLFDITDVYRPIQETLTPMLHVFSVCRRDQRDELRCQSRGIVGPTNQEMQVTEKNIYLWLGSDFYDWGYGNRGPESCSSDTNAYSYRALPAAVFLLPIETTAIRAIHTIGVPSSGFALDERDDGLHVVLLRKARECYFDYEVTPAVSTTIPLTLFRSRPATLDSEAYLPLAPLL